MAHRVGRTCGLIAAVACGGSIAGGPDAPPRDAGSPEVVADGADGGDDGDYHEISEARFWSSVDIASLLMTPLSRLDRACFDGRYVYWGGSTINPFVGLRALLVRYDTRGAFADLSSWSVWEPYIFDLNSRWPMCDGGYVYVGTRSGAGTRYDTAAPFGDPKSLSYSTALLGGLVTDAPAGLGPATAKNRYAYFPLLQQAPTGKTVRYDTEASFEKRASWSVFDPGLGGAMIDNSATDVSPGGPISVGPYVLLPPSGAPGAAAVLYDTRRPFDDPGAWSRLALEPLTGAATSYAGAGTDGRYVYFVPRSRPPSPMPWTSDGSIVRYDSTVPPAQTAAVETFDATSVHPKAKGFGHASWDGRFFYFMVGDELAEGAVVLRYDTARDFKSTASWSAFDMTTLNPKLDVALWSGGVVFDGAFVYMAARLSPIFVRFHARSPARMPPGFSGTFF